MGEILPLGKRESGLEDFRLRVSTSWHVYKMRRSINQSWQGLLQSHPITRCLWGGESEIILLPVGVYKHGDQRGKFGVGGDELGAWD